MCVDHAKTCVCGRSSASFNFKNEVMPPEVVNRLYCPTCSADVKFNPETMLADNGWIIEYDMDVARFMKQRLPVSVPVSPDYLFDEGYCTWRGVYPTDHIDVVQERQEIVALAKTDQKRYLEEIKTWGIKRMERLASEGWRKAHERQ